MFTFTTFFGTSLIFGNKLDTLPALFQPFLFYPDLVLGLWPYQIYYDIVYGLNATDGDIVGLSLFWVVFGCFLGIIGTSRTVKDFAQVRYVPFNRTGIETIQREEGILGQVFCIPFVMINVVWCVLYKLVVYSMFWQIIIATVFGCLVYFSGIGRDLSNVIWRASYVVAIVPSLVALSITLGIIVVHVI